MPGWHRGPIIAARDAQHGDTETGDRVPQQPFVTGRAHPVEHHPAQAHPVVPRGEAVHGGGHRAAHGGRVEHQHDRGVEKAGHMGGRGEVGGLAGSGQ